MIRTAWSFHSNTGLDLVNIYKMSRRTNTRSKQTEKAKEEKPGRVEEDEWEDEAEKKEKEETKGHFSLYDLLEVKKDATPDEIKKQYRKLVLQYHPDKNKEDSARQKFQKLKEAYDILLNAEKRREYDETGTVGEDFNESTFEAAYNYYRTIYKKVTPEDIKSFEERYRFGPMEEEDLVSYYNDQKGSMAALIESIPLSSNEDIPRFIKFFEESIENKTLPKLKLFEKTKGKIRLLKDESAEFEEERLKDMGALVAAIQGKSGNRQTDFISELQKKYGVGGKKKADPKLRKKKE